MAYLALVDRLWQRRATESPLAYEARKQIRSAAQAASDLAAEVKGVCEAYGVQPYVASNGSRLILQLGDKLPLQVTVKKDGAFQLRIDPELVGRAAMHEAILTYLEL